MYTRRNLILHLICASALTTLNLHAQERIKPTNAGQMINNYNQQAKNEENQQKAEDLQNPPAPARGTKPTQAGTIGSTYTQQQPQTQQRSAVGNRDGQSARANPPQDQRQAESQADVRQRAPVVRSPAPEARVLPGQGNRPAADAARVVPGANSRVLPGKEARAEARVVPGNNRVIPGSNATTGARVIPGSRPLGQRPVVVQRSLPSTIVIDRRCAPCPYLTLTPYAISKKGDLIELDDGSVWEVRHRDRRSVKRWAPGDLIVIETGQFFSWSTYKLVNYSRHESVDVELSMNQGWGGRSSHWIVEVNPIQGYLRLEDGSIWRMSASELAQWRVNDDVILGLSKDWFSDQYTYVLINPRAKNRFIAIFEF